MNRIVSLAFTIIGLGGAVLIGAALLSIGVHPVLSLMVVAAIANLMGYIEGSLDVWLNVYPKARHE